LLSLRPALRRPGIDRKFLWQLTRYKQVYPRQVERLDRIVEQLNRYAQEAGIVWP
jgi:hypothetical protein